MKRLALASLALLLTACPQQPVPLVVPERTIDAGNAIQMEVNQPFDGEWFVVSHPDWAKVSNVSGTGTITFTVTIDRHAATPLAADQAQLLGQIEVNGKSADGTEQSTALWDIKANQYKLSGQVVQAVGVQGNDLSARSVLPGRQSSNETRSLIVTYRDPAVRDAVLGQGKLSGSGVTLDRAQAARDLLTRLDVSEAEREPLTEQSVVLRGLSAQQARQVQAALAQDPSVASAVPNAVMHELATPVPPVVPTDQYAPLQWAYKLLGYGAVWRDMEQGGYTRPVVVAVADSGVRYDHPDLAGQLLTPQEGALDVLTVGSNGDGDGADNDPTDPKTPGRTRESHGTHVTGIIAARWGQNTVTCAGCSPTGVVGATYKAPVKVLPIRLLDVSGNTEASDVIAAVRYAAGQTVNLNGKIFTNPRPAQVLNLSLGGAMPPEEAQPMCDAIAEARERGVLTFVAAGNASSTTPYYPAACPAAVAVASVTLSGGSAPMHATYSNAYSAVQLSAPGGSSYLAPTYFTGGELGGERFPDDIVSTGWDYVKNQPNYTTMAGTSQATPQVSALAALLLSKGVTKGPEDTLKRLIDTSTDLGQTGRDPLFGFGMVNAAAALNAPAVSNTFGLRLQDERGHSYQPPLDALGRFNAYVGEGTYRAVGGRDLDGNGIYGEIHEGGTERRTTLSPEQPQADVGVLSVPAR
ncbi:S8 family serine peptidase [Deinococcus sp. VB142]|uniref:S8 family serine peptidase n=1 Tax=Deinococcus sp. VB142 TaxID=3112952 RepID=A0AAU6Q290_9DEIO